MTPEELWALEQEDYNKKTVKKKEEKPKEETSLVSKANTVLTRLGRVGTADMADEGIASFATGSIDPMIAQGLNVIPGGGVVDAASKLYSRVAGNDPSQYEEKRDVIRDYFKKAQAANPGLDTAANIGGNIALGFTPMGAIGRGMSVGRAALQSGALGAMQGLGESEGTTKGEILKDAAISGGISGVLGGASQGLSKGIDKGIGFLKGKLSPAIVEGGETVAENAVKPLTGGDKIKSYAARALGVTEKDAPKIIQNADDILRLQKAGTTQEQFENLVKRNTQELSKLHKEAVNSLSAKPEISKDALLETVNLRRAQNRAIPVDMEGKAFTPKETIEGFDVKSQEIEKAHDFVENLINKRLEKNPSISPKDLKQDINRELDRVTKEAYDPRTVDKKSLDFANELKQVRRDFDQNFLKTNKDYAQIMEKVAPLTNTNDRLGKHFGLKNISEEGAFDKAAEKLALIQKNQNPLKYKTENRLLKRLDPNLPRDIELRGLDERNVGGISHGSREVNLGGIQGMVAQHALGGLVGGTIGGYASETPYGAGLGALAGSVVNTHGRELGKRLLLSGRGSAKQLVTETAKVAQVPMQDAIMNVATPGVSKIIGFLGTKYFGRLQQALAKGGSAYIQEDFKLNNDAEYRALKRQQMESK